MSRPLARRTVLASLAAALAAAATPASATKYVYQDPLTENDAGGYVPKLELTLVPETTRVEMDEGDRFKTLFAPEVLLGGKPYDAEVTFGGVGLPPALVMDEQGDVVQDANAANLPAGTYSFSYVATDENGLKGASPPVTITVKAKPGGIEPSLPLGSCGQVLC